MSCQQSKAVPRQYIKMGRREERMDEGQRDGDDDVVVGRDVVESKGHALGRSVKARDTLGSCSTDFNSISVPLVDKIQLVSVIGVATGVHSVTCDLCGTTIKLGARGAVNSIMDHRGHDNCKRIMLRQAKKAAKQRNLCGLLIWEPQAGEGYSEDAEMVNTSMQRTVMGLI
ncbi:hypothetical protein FIBSPDRAFT_933465 [Athelia psychrophila]|uniref:Uncharacterized protein n=1 Tax=Athelia psychrophila TaxID=1759441 RepID=A0A166GZQ5_9AGAM|nr:hypothetical protein FIBSPDRAFT_933465 [Fibularhizoctonia sp. CBS 109695]